VLLGLVASVRECRACLIDAWSDRLVETVAARGSLDYGFVVRVERGREREVTAAVGKQPPVVFLRPGFAIRIDEPVSQQQFR
jgi:hypothetical protein